MGERRTTERKKGEMKRVEADYRKDTAGGRRGKGC